MEDTKSGKRRAVATTYEQVIDDPPMPEYNNYNDDEKMEVQFSKDDFD